MHSKEQGNETYLYCSEHRIIHNAKSYYTISGKTVPDQLRASDYRHNFVKSIAKQKVTQVGIASNYGLEEIHDIHSHLSHSV